MKKTKSQKIVQIKPNEFKNKNFKFSRKSFFMDNTAKIDSKFIDAVIGKIINPKPIGPPLVVRIVQVKGIK